MTDQPLPNVRPLWKKIAMIVAEVGLILLTVALIVAILLPVIKGVSKDSDVREPGLRMRNRMR